MTTDHDKLLTWRKAAKLTRQALAEATGYSISTITDMETGTYRSSGKRVDAKALQRYKLACATVAASLDAPWHVVIVPEIAARPVMVQATPDAGDD